MKVQYRYYLFKKKHIGKLKEFELMVKINLTIFRNLSANAMFFYL